MPNKCLDVERERESVCVCVDMRLTTRRENKSGFSAGSYES